MSDLILKAGVKIGGLSRKAQKLQALREKMAAAGNNGAKPVPAAGARNYKAKASNAPAKKTTFQRKAV